VEEMDEPRIMFVTSQGSKPHLPIKPRLVREVHRRRFKEISGFVTERNLKPSSRSLVVAF
jgi:hypothetical protein